MTRGRRGETRDYSDIFLGAILIGLVVIVLSLMVAIARSMSRLPDASGSIVQDNRQYHFVRQDAATRDGSAVIPY
jgi:hypothetical protein